MGIRIVKKFNKGGPAHEWQNEKLLLHFYLLKAQRQNTLPKDVWHFFPSLSPTPGVPSQLGSSFLNPSAFLGSMVPFIQASCRPHFLFLSGATPCCSLFPGATYNLLDNFCTWSPCVFATLRHQHPSDEPQTHHHHQHHLPRCTPHRAQISTRETVSHLIRPESYEMVSASLIYT